MSARAAALVVVLAAGCLAAPAAAEDFRCTFTEPSLTTVYRSATRTLTVFDPVIDYPKVRRTVYRHVFVTKRGRAKFEFRTRRGVLLHTLTLDHKGSDGMSDTIFPYSADHPPGRGPVVGFDGGCR